MTGLMVATLIAIAIISAAWLAAMIAVGVVGPRNRRIVENAADREVSAGGVSIRYRRHDATGLPIVFLHGFAGSLDDWNEVVARLPDRSWTSLDLVGHGGSGRPASGYDLESHHRHLVAFLDAVGLDRVVLVGFSMGGSIAAWTAYRAPTRVIGLVLAAPSAYPGSMTPSFPAGPLYRPGLANRAVRATVANPVYRRLFPRSLSVQALEVTSTYDHRFADALQHIRQPALLLWSETDETVDFSFAAEYRTQMPALVMIEAPEWAGHPLLARDPDGVASVVGAFLEDLDGVGDREAP